MATIEQTVVCFNLTNMTLDALANASINSSLLGVKEGINSETYAITKVCFVICLLTTMLHLLLLCCFPRIRQLYGGLLITGLACLFGAYFTTLGACSLEEESIAYLVFGGSANFCFLASIATNMLSAWSVCHVIAKGGGTSYPPLSLMGGGSGSSTAHEMWLASRVASAHGNQIGMSRRTGYPGDCSGDSDVSEETALRNCCGWSNRFQPTSCAWYISLLWGIFVVAVVLVGPVVVVLCTIIVMPVVAISPDHLKFANVSCNLTPNRGQFILFFPCLFSLLLAQLVFIGVAAKLRLGPREDRIMRGQERQVAARFWITLKLAVTHTIAWVAALVSLLYASVAVWHIFTLCSSLQAIYITVNCLFSRPVLDLVHRWRDEKIEEQMKVEHGMLIRQAASQPQPSPATQTAPAIQRPNHQLDHQSTLFPQAHHHRHLQSQPAQQNVEQQKLVDVPTAVKQGLHLEQPFVGEPLSTASMGERNTCRLEGVPEPTKLRTGMV